MIYDRLRTLLQVVGVVVRATPQNFAWALRRNLASNSSRDREVRFRMQMLGDVSWRREPLSGSMPKRATASSP